jgi:hypothetical protein
VFLFCIENILEIDLKFQRGVQRTLTRWKKQGNATLKAIEYIQKQMYVGRTDRRQPDDTRESIEVNLNLKKYIDWPYIQHLTLPTYAYDQRFRDWANNKQELEEYDGTTAVVRT